WSSDVCSSDLRVGEEGVVVDLHLIQVGLEVAETRDIPVQADAVQVVLRSRTAVAFLVGEGGEHVLDRAGGELLSGQPAQAHAWRELHVVEGVLVVLAEGDRKSTRLNSSHVKIS